MSSIMLESEYVETTKQVARQKFGSQDRLAINLSLSRTTVNTFLNGKEVGKKSARRICEALELDVNEVTNLSEIYGLVKPRISWGASSDPAPLKLRAQELNNWIAKFNPAAHRLVLIEGMKGMGKTNLSRRFAQQIHEGYEFVVWRSLDQFVCIEDLLIDWLNFFDCESLEAITNSESLWSRLEHYLKKHRCLFIITNIDHYIDADNQSNTLYQDLLKMLTMVVSKQHKSCLVVTSGVKAKEINSLVCRYNSHVLRWEVKELPVQAVKEIFREIELGSFRAIESDWSDLQEIYCGNPFVLKNVALNIRNTFASSISDFLAFNAPSFNGMHEFLATLLSNLNEKEQDIVYWLAICHHPVSLFELQEVVAGTFDHSQLLTTLKSLGQRFLIEFKPIESEQPALIVQPPMIREFVVNELVSQMSKNIIEQDINLLSKYPLLTTSSRAALLEAQQVFLLDPVVKRLRSHFGTDPATVKYLKEMLKEHQRHPNKFTKYASGNLVNLLIRIGKEWLNKDLSLSNLTLKNVDFRDVVLDGIDFQNTDLSGSLFLNGFGNILSTAFSPDGNYMATGDASDQVYIWKINGNRLVLNKILPAHNYWVRALAFSPDSSCLASAGEDGRIYLRDVKTWSDITIPFEGHTDRIRAIAFSSDQKYLASGSDDQTVRIWDLARCEFLTSLVHHKTKVRAVEFFANGCKLLSASQDSEICIWKFTRENEIVLEHSYSFTDKGNRAGLLRTVSISPDGRRLASGHDDGIVRLWDLETGQFKQQFENYHRNWIRCVKFSSDGQIIASSSEDKTVCLWDANTGERKHTLQNHSERVWSIAFHPKRSWLISGGDDLRIKLWDTNTGDCLKVLKGYTHETRPIAYSSNGEQLATGNNQGSVDLKDSLLVRDFSEKFYNASGNIWALCFTPDGHCLVAGSDDKCVKIWNALRDKSYPESLAGHRNWIRAVACSPDGKLIASGSDDKTIRIWDAKTNKHLHTFDGKDAHTDWVRALAFHPTEAHLLFSAGDDGNIKAWNTEGRELVHSIHAGQMQIWAISIDPSGTYLASGGNDKTLRIWDLKTFQCLQTLGEHRGWLSSVAFSSDGQYLASASYDTTIHLWQLEGDKFVCRKVLHGHGKAVTSITFHPDSLQPMLASSSKDGSIRLWNVETGELLQTSRSPKPYEAMNLTGVTGLTAAEKHCLRDLGAVGIA